MKKHIQIFRTMKSMQRTDVLRVLAIILLGIIRSTHQTVYSCNASASCGCSTQPVSITRIVGGETAGTATWGWAVSISIGNTYLCGGSIISSSWVVTAAHCVTGYTASQITIYAGSTVRFSGTQTSLYIRVITLTLMLMILLCCNSLLHCHWVIHMWALSVYHQSARQHFQQENGHQLVPQLVTLFHLSFFIISIFNRLLLLDGVHWVKVVHCQQTFSKWLYRQSLIMHLLVLHLWLTGMFNYVPEYLVVAKVVC